ncbi:DUF4157 domain-containing protein [Viridibacterium curvum]|uniref:eCIS core domain-containing protein n=1 Tax=Viridibacterium curvum TaxID=1101404 RepID=A0ABP9QUQ2_9RHOO
MSTAVTTKTTAPTVQRAAQVNRATTLPAPVRVPSPPVTVQCAPAMKVSSPNDAAEKEAEETAKRVMQMPAGIKRPGAADQPGGKSGGTKTVMRSAWQSPYLARMAGLIVQRESALARMVAEASPRGIALVQRQKRSASTVDGQVDVSANLAAEIRNARGGGSPLPPSVRRFMEPRFDADFSGVRVHTGEQAAGMSQDLSAKAFTVGQDIFFGAGQFKPDTAEGKELLAHELTHTVQQGGAKQGAGAQRSVDDSVVHREPVAEGTIQRDLLPDPWDYVKEKADSLPGYPLFKVIIGYDPLNQTSVPRDAGNIMRGVISLLPGIGPKINEALTNHGVFAKVSAWVSTAFDAVKDVGKNIWNDVKQFIKNIGSKILGGLGALWESGKAIITGPIDQVIGLAKSLGTGIVELIKDLILKPIGAYAQTTSGYKILCGIMGKDPITGDAASLDGEALMGAFMDFVNQGETWATIKQAKAIPRTVAWFKQNTGILKQKVMAIPGLFLTALKSLTIYDIVLIPLAFIKLGKVFANFAGDFITWAAKAVWDLLEIVFDVVKPGVMGYVKQTGGALRDILKNPMPFVRNLANAGKAGFNMFAGNFVNHLKKGLLNWLTGSLPGVYIPKSFDLMELFKLGLSVLGLSWANLREKLVKVLGEKTVAFAEGAVDVIITLKNQGPIAAWAQIKGQLGSLVGTIVDGITGLVVDAIVKKAIPKVVAMFIPGAGFISAIMSIVTLITTVYENIKQIAAVGKAIATSIVQIAAGNIGAAAKKVEGILAGMLNIAINFLLNFAVGKIADKVMGVIRKVRDPVDKALDAAIGWVVGVAKKLLAKLIGKGKDALKKLFNWGATKARFRDDTGHGHTIFVEEGSSPKLMIASAPKAADAFLAEYLSKKDAAFKDANKDKIGAVGGAISKARGLITTIAAMERANKADPALPGKQAELKAANDAIGSTVDALIKADGIVGPLFIDRKQLGWTPETIAHFSDRTKNPIWDTVKADAQPGEFRNAKFDIRHKISISDTISSTDAAIRPKKFSEAANMLKSHPKHPTTPASETKPGIVAAAREMLQKANNYLPNLFLGKASENRRLGKRYDDKFADGPNKANAVAAQKADFIEQFGFAGETFTITIERKSIKRNTSDLVEQHTVPGKGNKK